jgi:hypothetical protein
MTIGETYPWDPGVAFDHLDHERDAVGTKTARGAHNEDSFSLQPFISPT